MTQTSPTEGAWPALPKGREAWRPALILLAAAVLPALWRLYGTAPFLARRLAPLVPEGSDPSLYGSIGSFLACLVLMLALPALLARFVLRLSLRDLGMRAGDVRAGLTAVAALFPFVALLLLWPSSGQADFRAEYPLFRSAGGPVSLFIAYELVYGVYYIGWEFFYRGFMLFGLKDSVGALNAVLIQTIPSTLVHIGKPQGEVFAAVLGGVLFGAIALRTRSILYVFLLHWLIGVGLDVFIVMGTR